MKYKLKNKRTSYFSSSKKVYRFLQRVLDGGKGSGFWGHKGRPGKVGGSSSTGGAEISLDNLTDAQIKEILDSKELKDKWGGAGKRLSELALTNKSIIKRIQSALSGGKTIFKSREDRDAADELLKGLEQGSVEYEKLNKRLRQDDFFADLIDIAETKFGTGIENKEPLEDNKETEEPIKENKEENIKKSSNPKDWNKAVDSKLIGTENETIDNKSIISDRLDYDIKKILNKIPGISPKIYVGELNDFLQYFNRIPKNEQGNYYKDIKENIGNIIENFRGFKNNEDVIKLRRIIKEKYWGIGEKNKFMVINLIGAMDNLYYNHRGLLRDIADRLYGKNKLDYRDTYNEIAFDFACLYNMKITNPDKSIEELKNELDIDKKFIDEKDFNEWTNKIFGDIGTFNNSNRIEYYEDSNNDYLDNRIEELYTAKLNKNGEYIESNIYTGEDYNKCIEDNLNSLLTYIPQEQLTDILNKNRSLIDDKMVNQIYFNKVINNKDELLSKVFKGDLSEYNIDYENLTKENINEITNDIINKTDDNKEKLLSAILLKGIVEKLDNGMNVEDFIRNYTDYISKEPETNISIEVSIKDKKDKDKLNKYKDNAYKEAGWISQCFYSKFSESIIKKMIDDIDTYEVINRVRNMNSNYLYWKGNYESFYKDITLYINDLLAFPDRKNTEKSIKDIISMMTYRDYAKKVFGEAIEKKVLPIYKKEYAKENNLTDNKELKNKYLNDYKKYNKNIDNRILFIDKIIPQWTSNYKVSSKYNEEVINNSLNELKNMPSIKSNYIDTTKINTIDFKNSKDSMVSKIKSIFPNIDLKNPEVDNHSDSYKADLRDNNGSLIKGKYSRIWDHYFKAHAYANGQKLDNRNRIINYELGKDTIKKPKKEFELNNRIIINTLSQMTNGGSNYFPALDGNFGGLGAAIRAMVACGDKSTKTQWRAEDMSCNYRNYKNLKVGDSITFNAQHFTDNQKFFDNSAINWFGEGDPIVFELQGEKPLLNLTPYASSGKLNEYESLVAGFCKVKAIEKYTNGKKTCKKIVLEYDWDKINEYIKLQAKSYANELGYYDNYKNKKENN